MTTNPVHPTTGFTPFYLRFSRQARMPMEFMYVTPGTIPVIVSAHVARLNQNLKSAYISMISWLLAVT